MNKIRNHIRWPVWLTLMLMMLVMLGTGNILSRNRSANSANPPPFDFSDAFYLANGLDPSRIRERAGNADRNPLHWTVDNSNTDPNRRNIRILETTGGFDNSGNLIYYSIMGVVFPDTFTNDAAGQRAREIANRFRAFLFPRDPDHDGVVVLSPAPSNRRQDNVFDTRDGYFSNNPLGNWILAFVVFTDKAFTPEGRKELDPIAAVNGRDLDGTPILKSASQIDNLVAKGFVRILNRAQDGSQGFPWVI